MRPLIGTFLVHKRLSLMGDGIGHMAFAGVAAGLLLGVSPLWAALLVAVAGAVTIEWLRLRRRPAATSPWPCSSTPALPPAWS